MRTKPIIQTEPTETEQWKASAPTTPNRSRLPLAALGFIALLLAATLLPRVHQNPNLLYAFFGAGGALLLWAAALFASGLRSGRTYALELVAPLKSHYIQGGVQLCIYGYWGTYWTDVFTEIPLILSQLVFLYALEALIAWSRGRAWRLGCGPIPIILSTNVFLWFKDDWFAFQFAMIALAALGKEFVRWERDGRRSHIFNPSAFALAIVSVILIATGTTEYTWAGRIADTFSKPEHIYLQVFLLGLIVQYFFSVTLMTLTAAATLALLSLIYKWQSGTYYFVFSNIPAPVFLGFHLLVTDPATSPRTNVGKTIFGFLYGCAVFVAYGILTQAGSLTVYDKLLPIPLLNLCVRWIDRIASVGWLERLAQKASALTPRRWNLVHMTAWATLFLAMLGSGYVGAQHEGRTLEFWRKALAEGRPNAGKGLVEVLKAHTRADSTDAWNEMGGLYLRGELVPKDPTMAAKCFARASKLGSLAGSANLVTQFLAVEGAKPAKAILFALDHLETQCSKGADPVIYRLVGRAYEFGKGRPQDDTKARAYYKAACKLGDKDGCADAARLRPASRPADSK